MTINFKLGDVDALDPARDRWHRTWTGWSPELTDQETYEQNRGVWILGRRAHTHHTATFSHRGRVKVVPLDAAAYVEEMPAL